MNLRSKKSIKSINRRSAKRKNVAVSAARPALYGDPLYLNETLVPAEGTSNILDGLTEAERRSVLRRGRLRRYQPGEAVFRQGEVHKGIFLIMSGRFRSFYGSAGGREITLAYWNPGNFIGGPEIFGGGEHMWSGEACEEGDLLYLPGHELKDLVRQMPSFSIGLIEALVYKAKCYSAVLQLLGTKAMNKRLVQLILNCATQPADADGQVTVNVPLTHEELGNMIGATRQWVSLSLSRLAKEGILATRRNQIVILDIDHLREIAV